MSKSGKSQKGFTLIELLVVVAIIGILAAIALVNFFIALDRAKQKKSMSDMRTISIAWEELASDRGQYSAAGATAAFVWPSEPVNAAQLKALLEPTYLRPMTRADGWGGAFEFALDAAVGDTKGAVVYGIRSPGKDGIFETSYPVTETKRFECDIVLSNGSFVVRPATN